MVKRFLFRSVLILVLVFGVICLAFPFANLFLPGGTLLVLDTQAYFMSNQGPAVPAVSQVLCVSQSFGIRSRSSSNPMHFWTCEVSPADQPGATRNTQAPPAGSAYAPIGTIQVSATDSITRELPFDRTGSLPELRQVSEEGEPLKFGVTWGGKDLLLRWLHWIVVSLIFLVFAAGCFLATKVGWKKTRLPSTVA